MKKILRITGICAGLLFFGPSTIKAQCFETGKSIISIGYGFPNWDAIFLGSITSGSAGTTSGVKTTGVGPAHLKYEYAVSDKIGVGLSINYSSTSTKWQSTESKDVYDVSGNYVGTTTTTYDYNFSTTNIAFNPRINIHFATTDKIDAYWGIGAGYKMKNYSFSSTDPDYSGGSVSGKIPVGFETTVGMRYYFTENIGAYTELGFSRSLIQFGLTGKF